MKLKYLTRFNDGLEYTQGIGLTERDFLYLQNELDFSLYESEDGFYYLNEEERDEIAAVLELEIKNRLTYLTVC